MNECDHWNGKFTVGETGFLLTPKHTPKADRLLQKDERVCFVCCLQKHPESEKNQKG